MAGATRLIARTGSAAPNGSVRFPGEFFIMAGAFALGQVLNFGCLAYMTDCYGKLHPLNEVPPVGNEPRVLPKPLGLLGANLEVLAQQT
jgi:hypothetical protein